MKNSKTLHEAAAKKIASIEQRFDELFKEAEAQCCGFCDNNTWRERYKSRYDAMDRMLDKAYRAFWYTDQTIPRRNKQANHRAIVANMRAAGLHRIDLFPNTKTMKPRTRKQYEDYLNEMGESLKEDEFIIGGKKKKWQIRYNAPQA